MKHYAFVPTIFLAVAALTQGPPDLNNWKLTIECNTPRAIVVQTKGAAARTVWCVTFTVKNQTGAAHLITPFISMTTDTNQTLAASFDPTAVDALRFYTNEQYTDLYALGGGLEDGASKRCVAVFDFVDPMANHYTLHFGGFAAALVRKGKEFTQQQVEFRAKYYRAGNEFQVCSGRVTSEGDEWATLDSKKVR